MGPVGTSMSCGLIMKEVSGARGGLGLAGGLGLRKCSWFMSCGLIKRRVSGAGGGLSLVEGLVLSACLP